MDLLQNMGPKETKFVIRFILKNLKVGANEAIMEMSLAQSLCKNFHRNKEWYSQRAVPICLKILSQESTGETESDILKISETFRVFGMEDKDRFFMSYIRQMESFRKKKKIEYE